jgi:hypothetical protein
MQHLVNLCGHNVPIEERGIEENQLITIGGPGSEGTETK